MSDKKKLLVVIDPGHTGNTYNAGAVSGEVSQKQAQNGHLEYPKVTDHSLSGCRLYRQRNRYQDSVTVGKGLSVMSFFRKNSSISATL